jgi:hypothetical protein cdiviTM7_00195
MSEVSENIYPLLVEHGIHDRMEDRKFPYNVVGGLGLHAVTNAAEIDWDNRVVCLPNGVDLPRLRKNGTVRDLDTLVQSTDKTVVKSCRQEITDAIGDKLVVSAFGLNPYEKNRRGIFDFVGDRYVDDEGRLYWRLGGIETEIPPASLDQWLVKRDGETVCAILNPIAQLGAYGCRSITGWRPKDTEKVEELINAIMPNRKISDIPQECRDQYYTFREQSRKVAEARQKLGWFGLKAGLLSFLEHQEWAVRLAQGELDGVLSGFVGKT